MANEGADATYGTFEPGDYDAAGAFPTTALHPVLAALCPIVPALAQAVGRDSEVALHDLSKLPNSIIAIGGTVTGRKPGDPMTDLLAKLIRQGLTEHAKNYRTVLPDGRVLRSSTLFIKDNKDTPIGCLCVNTDISGWLQLKDLIMSRIDPQMTASNEPSSFHQVEGGGAATNDAPSATDNEPDLSEFFVSTVEDLQRTMVEKSIAAIDVPLHLMTKVHKMKVVQRLEESGFFLIRDSAEYLAQAIGVTRYTIYNYLNQLRVSNKFSDTDDDPES